MIELRDEERTKCEVWTRVMGYHRPVSAFNPGKQQEHRERMFFREDRAMERLNNLQDLIEESILEASDEEIIEDMELAGNDPHEVAEKIRGLFAEISRRI